MPETGSPKKAAAGEIWNDAAVLEELGQDILKSSTDDIINRTRLLENEIKIMKSEFIRLQHEQANMEVKIKDNKEKIKLNKQLPYLVSNIVEASVVVVLRGEGRKGEGLW